MLQISDSARGYSPPMVKSMDLIPRLRLSPLSNNLGELLLGCHFSKFFGDFFSNDHFSWILKAREHRFALRLFFKDD
ncbi:unnamed protein product [Linum trigynum]|uniref:Maturase K n=1 Tax=Linum trigynum TaxID=586398 RepID=A0AAV2GXT4_9ROSI